MFYVKVTDNAGNITYFGSEGTTFDLVAPEISGITDGRTYYTDLEAKTADLQNLLNGISADNGDGQYP